MSSSTVSRGSGTRPDAGGVGVAHWSGAANTGIVNEVARPRVRASTLKSYREIVEGHLVPGLGNEGRIAAAALMILGITLFAAITATITSRLVTRGSADTPTRPIRCDHSPHSTPTAS